MLVHGLLRTFAGLSFLTLVYIGFCISRTPYSSIVGVNLGQSDLLTSIGRPRFYERTSSFLLRRAVNISRPITYVTKAALTPDLWRICYPETIALGGVSQRAMKPGDIILEKFLFNGVWYVMFRYTVESDDIEKTVRFHGIAGFANEFLQSNFQWIIDRIGGTFEYKFREVDGGTTEWTRDLHLYTTSSNPVVKVGFWFAVSQIRNSQERGASFFLECAKVMLERYEEDVFAEHVK